MIRVTPNLKRRQPGRSAESILRGCPLVAPLPAIIVAVGLLAVLLAPNFIGQ